MKTNYLQPLYCTGCGATLPEPGNMIITKYCEKEITFSLGGEKYYVQCSYCGLISEKATTESNVKVQINGTVKGNIVIGNGNTFN